jgi:NAD(P)-dependent dehydrogenase (short-subunit alcohol dehydrogenase family)
MPITNGRRERTGLITGAASGLGRAIALRLARDGWNLALADVNDVDNDETLRLVQGAGGDGFVEHLDVRNIDEWQALRERLQDRWQKLDLLVNNAGVAGSGRVGEYSIENWHWIIDINLWNGINGCHTFVEWLKANPNGAHIINTCSLAAIVSAPTMAAYNVTKAGMLALSETLYSELMPHNVGVTAVCPSVFRTNLLEKSRWCQPEERQLFVKGFAETKMTADFVADAAIKAMQRKQLYVVVPFEARFNWYLKRLAPNWLLKKVSRMFETQLQLAAKWQPAAEAAPKAAQGPAVAAK